MWKSIVIATSILLAIAPANAKDDVADVNYLAPLEQEIVRELNLARTDPKTYASFIKAWLPYLDGDLLRLPDRTPVRTKEGGRALKAAIRFLEDAKATHELEPMEGMSLGAKDHVNDLGPTGGTGHRGSDGTTGGDRINRYGKWGAFTAENICYGSDTAREIVMRLIIDDGVPERGHRTNIFNRYYYVVGVACGPHDIYGTMCVINFAGDYWD